MLATKPSWADSRLEVDVWRLGELESGMDVLASLKSSLPVLSTVAKQQWVGAVPIVNSTVLWLRIGCDKVKERQAGLWLWHRSVPILF